MPSPVPFPPHRRLMAWLATGPIGHFVGGALDWLQLGASIAWARARGKPPPWES